jgi:hypothetical protein
MGTLGEQKHQNGPKWEPKVEQKRPKINQKSKLFLEGEKSALFDQPSQFLGRHLAPFWPPKRSRKATRKQSKKR